MDFVDELPSELRAPTVAAAKARAALQAWAADHGGQRVPPLALIEELGRRLNEANVAVARIACTLADYHPEYVGRQYNWHHVKGPEQIDRRYTPAMSDTYVMSPIRVIREGAAALRRRLTGPNAQNDFPILGELAADGMTDYVALPLAFSNGSRNFIAFATSAENGFEGHELAFLETLLPQLCLRIEVEHSRHLTDQLLEVYLGHYAAPRVLGGENRRIRGEAIQAIILAVDMRGFTGLTDALDPDAVFTMLSVFYDAVAEPVIAAGGDVVKMIADGILAVFPVPPQATPEEITTLARKASMAARDAVSTLSALTPDDLPTGAWPIRAGFALHTGDVTFGNIGSRDRLDFTLIGPAVNEAFRIEALTKTLEKPILISAPFADLMGRTRAISLGFHPLRGVREPKEIFTLSRGMAN